MEYFRSHSPVFPTKYVYCNVAPFKMVEYIVGHLYLSFICQLYKMTAINIVAMYLYNNIDINFAH